MPTILFVINPISGGKDKGTLKEDIERLFVDYEIKFFETTGKNDPEKLSEKIQSFRPDRVVACGGDGTINLVSSQLIERSIPLGIIPLGSANGLATELEIPETLTQSINIIKGDRQRKVDILVINEKYYSLHLADIGFNAKMIKHFEQSGIRGKWGYARQFVKTLFTQETLRYHFKIEDHTFSKRAQMVSFANARKYGTGAVINPDGKMDDGVFEICIFRPYPWYALFGLVFRFFTGSLKKSKYVKIVSTKEARVFMNKPETLQVDGETIGEFKEITVTILPLQMSIIIP